MRIPSLLLAASCAFGAFGALGACGESRTESAPQKSPCERLLAKQVAAQASTPPGASPDLAEGMAEHRRILTEKVGPRVLAHCESAGAAWVNCALAAENPQDQAACAPLALTN